MPVARFVTRFSSILLATTAAALITAPAANAQEANVRNQADALMQMTYVDFVEFRDEQQPAPFDWTEDGCSGPEEVQFIYRDLFDGPCQQHDFGYDNYGFGPLELGMNEDFRAWIDNRFLDEMYRVCDRNFGSVWETYNKIFCEGQAVHVWGAVRHRGHDAFYNE